MQHREKYLRYSEKKIRLLLRLQQTKDLSVAEFSKTHNISKATFYNWRKKYTLLSGRFPAIEKHPDFIPVSFNDAIYEPGLFAEVKLSPDITVKIYQKVEASYFKALI